MTLWTERGLNLRYLDIFKSNMIFKTDSFNNSLDFYFLRASSILFIHALKGKSLSMWFLFVPNRFYCLMVSETFLVVRIAMLCLFLYDDAHILIFMLSTGNSKRMIRNDPPNIKSKLSLIQVTEQLTWNICVKLNFLNFLIVHSIYGASHLHK